MGEVGSAAVGVGHNEHAIAEVRGTNGRRGDAIPFRIVPALGQVSENTGHASSSKEPWDVLQQCVAGS